MLLVCGDFAFVWLIVSYGEEQLIFMVLKVAAVFTAAICQDARVAHTPCSWIFLLTVLPCRGLRQAMR